MTSFSSSAVLNTLKFAWSVTSNRLSNVKSSNVFPRSEATPNDQHCNITCFHVQLTRMSLIYTVQHFKKISLVFPCLELYANPLIL